MADWLSSWAKRRKITIPSSKIDGVSAFTDSSSGGKSPSATVVVTETKAQGKFGGSAFFGGSSKLEFADHDDWCLGGGTGDFTIDFWVRFPALPALSGYNYFCSQYYDSTYSFTIYLINSAGNYSLVWNSNAGTGTNINVNRVWASPAIDTWYHIAFVRSGTSFMWFVDGTQLGLTATSARPTPNAAAVLGIGSWAGTANSYMFLDEFRISDSARWTSNFTPPSAAYTDDANTKLLLHFEPTDADLTDFPVAIRIDASAGTGASDLTDIFDVLGSNSLKLAVTTSDGTTQCYVEVALWDDTNEIGVLFVKAPSVSGSADTELYLYYDNTQADNSTYVGVVGSTAGKLVWDENFLAVYHLTETPAGAGSIKDSTRYAIHGEDINSPTLVDGALDKALDLEKTYQEYVKLPGKTEATLDTGNTGHTVVFNSTACISHGASKFGKCSLYLNGSSDFLSVADHADWLLPSNGDGTGEFTIDAWVNITALPASGASRPICGQRSSSSAWWEFVIYNGSGTYAIRLYCYTGSYICMMSVDFASAPTINEWHHIAVSRDSSNVMRAFWDGSQVGSDYSNSFTFPDIAAQLTIGYNTNSRYFAGYMDEVRLSNICRWSAVFTPPSAALASDANTKLLLQFTPVTASVKGAQTATYEATFKMESWVASASNGLLYESNTTAGYLKIMLAAAYVGANDSRLQFCTRETNTGTAVVLNDPKALALDTWFYGAGTLDAINDRVCLFKNGLLVNANTAARAGLPNLIPVQEIGLGAYTHSAPMYSWDGVIDEARISVAARSQGWLRATKESLLDTLVFYSAVEGYTIPTALGVAQVVVSALGVAMEAAATTFLVGDPAALEAQAHDLLVKIYSAANLGSAEIVVDAHGIAYQKIVVFISGAQFTVLKPLFTCSGQSPSFGVSAGVKPTATAVGVSPSHSVSGIKPKATFDAEVG